MAERSAERSYEQLKQAVLRLGFARPGSLVHRFMACGKPACRCMADPPMLHGPYHQWTHKVRGKTVTLRLTAVQAKACEQWGSNHRRLKSIVRKMEKVSLKETDRILSRMP